MTQAEKKLLQDTHDGVIKLQTIIIGNGVEGLADAVKNNRKKIADQEKRFDKAYYKIIGGGFVIVLLAEILAKLFLR